MKENKEKTKAKLDSVHKYLISNKLLHGIEIVNELTYSRRCLNK